MLATLQIEDYALIDRLSIDFGPGFNVLTGETGSGKSIIVDALGLLLGERAEGVSIRSGAPQAIVTGTFASPFASAAAAADWCQTHGLSPLEREIRLRREIHANGRSRAFIDHQLASVGLLRSLARQLGEIHSQNESLSVFTPAAQLQLLDRFAGLDSELAAVAATFALWSEWQRRLDQHSEQERLRLQQADTWRFQAEEITAAHLQPASSDPNQPSEDVLLERERAALANAEKISASCDAAYDCLYEAPAAALVQLKTAQRHVSEWARFDESAANLIPRLEAVRAEVADMADQIRARASRQQSSPQRLAEVEDRLHLLDRLKRKYGPTLADVIRHGDDLAARIAQMDNAQAFEAEARARVAAAAADYRRLAASLSTHRRKAAARLKHKLEAEVADLAMQLQFQVAFEPPSAEPEPDQAAWTAAGWDRAQFLASTNPGEPMLPVERIASGGELSRLLLALHLVSAAPVHSHSTRPPQTLVLDEIDAGIGGRAADAVGKKLQQLGAHYQVLCVTHLAQIASYASHHIRVEKIEHRGRGATRTATAAHVLDLSERVPEIARMLAGDHLNPTSLRHAEELLTRRGSETTHGRSA